MTEKLIFFLHRAPGIDREEFCERYLRERAPLLLERVPDARRVVVDLYDGARESVEDFGAAAGEASLDGAVELSVDAGQSVARETIEDGELVVAAAGYRAREYVQLNGLQPSPIGERSPGRKLFTPLRRQAGLSHEAFVDHWLRVHSPLAVRHVLGMGRYVTNVVLGPVTAGAAEIDGIVEVHYTGTRAFDSPEGERIMREDVATFLSTPARHMASEYVLRSEG